MTAPVPPPTPDWTNHSIFCTQCQEYLATATNPVCPVCLDQRRRSREANQ